MFTITWPYTSTNYSTFYNKAIIIYNTEAKTFHKFDPATQTYSTPKASECKSDYKNSVTYTISDLVTRGYHNYQGKARSFSTLEEATLAKLYLLSELSKEITEDIEALKAKYAEACPPALSSAYDSLKFNYPEIFI